MNKPKPTYPDQHTPTLIPMRNGDFARWLRLLIYGVTSTHQEKP